MKTCGKSCSESAIFKLIYLLALTGVVLFFISSCSSRPGLYSVIEFSGKVEVSNYSKSFLLTVNKPDSLQPAVALGSKGDVFLLGDLALQYENPAASNPFYCRDDDSVLFLDDKVCALSIPDDGSMIPWFEKNNSIDWSGLQFISVASKIPGSYVPWLTKLAQTKPDAGLIFSGDSGSMAVMLKIFNPRTILGLKLEQNDYDLLEKLTKLETLMVSAEDSVYARPLPALPLMKQLFITEADDNVYFSSDFLGNNPQIERLIFQKSGSIDFAVLNPLENLRELVIRECDTILNPELISQHKKLELFSLAGEKTNYGPIYTLLPHLRWITVSAGLSQQEFDGLIKSQPDLEVLEIYKNDTVKNYESLANLRKLYGLTIVDNVTDYSTLKTLQNLRYLSLPADFLDKSNTRDELQKSLPNTRIAVNDGFCLGSGWLMLLIPFILIIRFSSRIPVKRDLKNYFRCSL